MAETKVENNYQKRPLIPSRGVVILPHMVVPLLIGRDKSIRALEKAMLAENSILVAAQRDVEVENPCPDDLYQTGCLAEIRQVIKLPNGMMKVILEGRTRAKIKAYQDEDEYFLVSIEPVKVQEIEGEQKRQAYMRSLLDLFKQYIKLHKDLTPEIIEAVSGIENLSQKLDFIASQIDISYTQQQGFLEIVSLEDRFLYLLEIIKKEIEILQLELNIDKKVREQVNESQKKYYLREKIKVIRDELEEEDHEITGYKEKILAIDLPVGTSEKIKEEIEKLKKITQMSPEATVIRNYLDFILDLPWNKEKNQQVDLKKAEEILNKDHYDLQEVKERILEFLAVKKIAPQGRGAILCFVGAPGVGKTSLGRSIARALGRDFISLSLGGVRDEAQIKGHRRTYIGSRPGRIIGALRDAGSKNPVFLLDEIDKMLADFRGDPAAALLEVLDPEQNFKFSDHYLEIPFDLSGVLFITTANVTATIPPPLLDRMEVIELPGYTEEDKNKIARNYLLPRILKEHGIKKNMVKFSNNAMQKIISEYTREAGVRNLEKKIATIIRKIARQIVEGDQRDGIRITVNNLKKYLGIAPFRHEIIDQEDEIGVALGMAYNESGGDLLEIEAAVVPGKGKIILTGSLGDVMQESARAALTYLRSKNEELNLADDFHEKFDLHIHVPQGAVPKDGPSAGITIALAAASALTKRPVAGNFAMSGEISLRGQVLPVGGLKTKILAAARGGIKEIIIPEKNRLNIEDISEKIIKKIKFNYVENMDQVIEMALLEGEKNNG